MSKKVQVNQGSTSLYNIERRNAPAGALADMYFLLIRMRWRYLLLLAFVGYLGVNMAFGGVYDLVRDGLTPPQTSFWDCFFFSVHTFSTVGYGNIVPNSLAVQAITVLETFVGLTSVAMMTGLIFAKFSRPSGRFLFTDRILVTRHQGEEALVFRVVNGRSNRVMDADLTLSVLYNEVSPEGIRYRRFMDLPLLRAHTPVLILSMTGAHVIDQKGPVPALLKRLEEGDNIEFLASVRGLDETFGQTIHSTYLYRPERLHRGGQFEDILDIRDDGTRTIDFKNFHRIKT